MRTRARETSEIGQSIECKIHLAGRAPKLVSVHGFHKIARKVLGAGHSYKRKPRIDTGRNDVGANLFAILENDAPGLAVRNDDFRDRRFTAYLGAGFARCRGNRVRYRARSSAHKPPRPECAVDFAHIMVQQNVGRARRSNAEEGSDNP